MTARFYWVIRIFFLIIANIYREVFFKPAVPFPCLILDIEINITAINIIFYLLAALQADSPQLPFRQGTTTMCWEQVTSHQKFCFKLESIFLELCKCQRALTGRYCSA